MFIFGYNVSYFDDIIEDSNSMSGIVCGADLPSAVKSLERWYGVGNIERINIFYLINDYGEVVDDVLEVKNVDKIMGFLEE